MFDIRTKDNAELAYYMIRHLDNNRPDLQQKIADLKRNLREYLNRKPDTDCVLVRGDWDWYISKETLPEFLKTKQEAIDWFETFRVIEQQPSAYDCTGRPSTCWYKIFGEPGKYKAYHYVQYDV